MRISIQWLREWLQVDETPEELGHRLTMAGLELDAIEAAAPAFSGVRVGRVTKVEPHPDADRLRVCQVEAGEAEPLTIVCGAPNVHEGMVAPVAVVGAVLPDNFKIKKSKLRGVASAGMLCSARELGLAEDAEGLLALPADLEIGADLRAALGLDDTILEVDLTPNRADCLGMRGIARECSALLDRPLAEPMADPVAAELDERVAVRVEDAEACPLYAARVLDGLDARAPTPLWMTERLRRAGVRPLSAIVDVTNYVMLELGQPLHAFDAGRVGDTIEVRWARSGESLTLLGGEQKVELAEQDLVIASTTAPVALAGIMGGADSAVDDDTTRVVLECAHFAPLALAGRARAHGLHTDASHRFERGVDPTLVEQAMERATRLLLEICGGQCGPVERAGELPSSHFDQPIRLRRPRIERLLGTTFEDAEVERILGALACRVESVEGGWQVRAPRARFDLEREEDLIEELARVHGYDRLPQRLPSPVAPAERSPSLRGLRDQLARQGFHEVISFSFIDAEASRAFYPAVEPLALANPISSDLAVMRPGLWPGLVATAAYNQARQQPDLRLCEHGLRFVPDASGLRQEPRLAGLLGGRAHPEHWEAPSRRVDFFDAKGVVEGLCASLDGPLGFRSEKHPALHDGQSARILAGDRPIGWVGRLHPALCKQFDVEPVYLFDLDARAILHTPVVQFAPLSPYPSIRRDLALVVKETVPAGDVLSAIEELALGLVQDVRLFDVYQGKGLNPDEKSLALGLILRAFDRTLGEQDVASVTDKVVEHLHARFQATLRQ
ncbi:phenylalanyl-tRNA synthetase, beta subunit [Thioalkalivibrio sp. K90mix]|uniref:phenylalanine--tRNA ligase subunit beta n=1 Tax=Thioalkalivibrio sp. (strain K90mix) TaxID=396595 RepID=UPI000195AA3B|nr:phenylalanine--tRNA ligase subunit beta [Thioalkalivibrio sp. K90mix]ADC71432.1 phenylalanyl-tRNA synthetase, beta subunit [Thioalkalivibrio sp. K90mix]